MAAGFASHASVALELADARAAEQRVVLLEDRERIARDLHDHVIQELFAIGLSLESVGGDDRAGAPGGQADQPAGRRHRPHHPADPDQHLRAARPDRSRSPTGIRQRVLAIAADLTPALGFAPNVAFAGAVDAALPSDMGDDVLACVARGADQRRQARAGQPGERRSHV